MKDKIKEHLEENWHVYFSGGLLLATLIYLFIRDYM